MSKISEYNKIKKRDRNYDRVSLITTVLGFVPSVRNNQKLSDILTVTGTVCSIASFINYMRKVEYYGTSDEISDSEILFDLFKNLVINPTVCSLSIAMNIGENNKQW